MDLSKLIDIFLLLLNLLITITRTIIAVTVTLRCVTNSFLTLLVFLQSSYACTHQLNGTTVVPSL